MLDKFFEFIKWSCCLIFIYNFHNFLDTNSIVYWYMEYGLNFDNLLSLFGVIITSLIVIFIWLNKCKKYESEKNLKFLKNMIDDILILFNGDIFENYGNVFNILNRRCTEFNYLMKKLYLNDIDLYMLESYHHMKIMSNNRNFIKIFDITMINAIEIFYNLYNESYKDYNIPNLGVIAHKFRENNIYYINHINKSSINFMDSGFDVTLEYFENIKKDCNIIKMNKDGILSMFQNILNFYNLHENTIIEVENTIKKYEKDTIGDNSSSESRIFNTLNGFFKFVDKLIELSSTGKISNDNSNPLKRK